MFAKDPLRRDAPSPQIELSFSWPTFLPPKVLNCMQAKRYDIAVLILSCVTLVLASLMRLLNASNTGIVFQELLVAVIFTVHRREWHGLSVTGVFQK